MDAAVLRLHVGACLLLTKSIKYLFVETFKLLPSPSPQVPGHGMGEQERAPGACGKWKALAGLAEALLQA